MQQRTLGRSNIQVAPLVLGGNVFGWTINEKQSFEVLDAFTDAGFNLIDTADVYSRWVPGNKGGESETIIGNWLKKSGKRDKVVIATKVGADSGEGKSLKAAYIRRSVDASLKRLQTDRIDLYQTHYDDESTPVEEPLETYTSLIREGKVRVIGTSNMSPARLEESLKASRANGYVRYETLQPEYNLYARQEFEQQYEGICVAEGLGVINYYALASGFLTGKYRSEKDLGKSQRGGGIGKYLNERGLGILSALDEVSQAVGATPAQIAIAWLLARPSVTAPIASATSSEQLKDLTAAVQLTLAPDAVERLDTASAYQVPTRDL